MWEFSKNADGNLNVLPEKVLVTSGPQARPECNIPEGMLVLQSLSGIALYFKLILKLIQYILLNKIPRGCSNRLRSLQEEVSY